MSQGNMKRSDKRTINYKIEWYLSYNYNIIKIFTQQYQE